MVYKILSHPQKKKKKKNCIEDINDLNQISNSVGEVEAEAINNQSMAQPITFSG